MKGKTAYVNVALHPLIRHYDISAGYIMHIVNMSRIGLTAGQEGYINTQQ